MFKYPIHKENIHVHNNVLEKSKKPGVEVQLQTT